MQLHSTERNRTSAADLAACRELLRGGSRTFHAASLVLPASVRDPATALYAFCRLADDAVDLDIGKSAALARLRERLDRVYAGHPMQQPADRAFAEVVQRFEIPRALPEALLEGFEWDSIGRRYDTLTDLNAYAARVAGTVGGMMALLMGVRSPDVLARACDLGVAMQLTNIARDVGEDARAGRLYLPCEWLRQEGIEPDRWLANPQFDAAIGRVVQRLLDAADALYARSATGIAWLPALCRPGMHAARVLYAEIGREVERQGLDSIARRAHVSWQRKLKLLPQVLFAAASRKQTLPEGALDEVRFLIDAAAEGKPMQQASKVRANRVLWLLDLFDRLERRPSSTAFEQTH